MITEKVKELENAREKIAQLEAEMAKELAQELGSLPVRYGFESVKAFIKAVKMAASGKPTTKAGKKGKRTRAVITDAIRAQVKKMVDADKSGAEIATALKISLPSVQNIKKALGLVKPRKK